MQFLKIRALALATALAVSPAFTQTALQGGFVEGADVMVFLNAQQMNNSPFSKAMEKQQPPEVAAAQKQMREKFTAATGLGENDILQVVMSMDIDAIDFQNAPDVAQMEKIPAVLAIQTAKSITLDQVAAGLRLLMEEKEDEISMTPASVDGLRVLEIKPTTPEAEGPRQLYATISPDGKNVLLGLNSASLKDGLDRIAAGKVAAPSADMGSAMKALGQRPMRMVVVLPAKARETIAQMVTQSAAEGGMGMMLAPFATTKSLSIGADMKENLELGVSLDLGNPNNAQQAAGMLQGMIPMFLMGMGDQMGENAMNVAQKLKIAPAEGAVSIFITLTPDDLKVTPPLPVPPM